jgi:hypothetical protein
LPATSCRQPAAEKTSRHRATGHTAHLATSREEDFIVNSRFTVSKAVPQGTGTRAESETSLAQKPNEN